MRRLPVYLLLDTSGSMSGEPIESVKSGIYTLVSSLRQDPYALETAFLSVITFDSSARQVVPMTELPSFQIPDIQASGTTAMGAALQLAASCRDQEIKKSTQDTKGDWLPLVFIMTDGGPTDDFEKGLAEFRNRKWGMVIACGAGISADIEVLKKITELTVQLDTTDSAAFQAFFKWVSASIGTSSKSIESTGKELIKLDQLPPPPSEITIVS